MSEQSAVDRQAMAKAAQDIDASAGVIKGLQIQLEGHKSEMRRGWEGNASMAFEKVFRRFDEEFKVVLRQLEEMHQKLADTKITYEAKEQLADEAVNKVQALLNGTT
ncbi:WXG100 family type VII secretion target [Actinomadura alba]|uniref:ESAT-6-like protein n=1 Tax=Actinomadura alba TaxID=406431 RepID=A0ABR7LPD1_9ACTN|nr:WXG100 family type VII secretion target [Actinomadura alba]MBC6466345.1 WXG100 family type VII secretion target [Actinomadura alba]